MVRLKGSMKKAIKLYNQFQFHYGTIKSQRSDIVAHLEARFQFHYGTIKRRSVLSHPSITDLISIPLWYD